MMGFTFARPATESIEMRPGEIDGNTVSASVHTEICHDALIGFMKSLTLALTRLGKPENDIRAMVISFLNLAYDNGDFMVDPTDEHNDVFKACTYQVDDEKWNELDKFASGQYWSDWCMVINSIESGISFASDCSKELQKKMNDREKALCKNLLEAEKAYYKAKEEYRAYVHDHAIETINDLLVKYGEAMSKLNKDWYEMIESRTKEEMKYLQERRARKQAEDDAAAGRPVAAE